MFRMVRVNEHERGLWFRRGEFQDLILPGSTWLLSWQDRVMVLDTRQTPRFEHPMLHALLDHARLRDELELVALDTHERAFIWRDGQLLDVLGPGMHAYWKTPAKLNVERVAMPRTWFDADPVPRNRIRELLNN